MKIIYLANIRFPTEKAHGVHYAKMGEALALAGHQLELWVAKRYNPKFARHDPYQSYGVKNNFIIKKLWVVDLLKLLIGWAGPLGTWLINLSFAKSAWWKLLFTRCDLVYSRDALPLLFLLFTHKKFIYELHEYRSKDQWLYRLLAKKGQGIVVITDQLKQLLIGDGIQTAKILVAADGVDIEKLKVKSLKLKVKEELNLLEETKIILYTGSLFRWKGVFALAQIFNFQFSIFNDCVLVFVGGMEHDIEELKKFIKQNNLPEDKIKFLGHQPYSEIPKYLAIADVLVLPNSSGKDISAKYTSPLKMFEYMASGKPIVASDLPSIREVLNENNAILVEPDNPESLARGIEKALTDLPLIEKIAKQAQVDVKEYTWDKRVEKIIKFIAID